jgi:hypothetical protein
MVQKHLDGGRDKGNEWMLDDLGSSIDKPRNGAPSRRLHPKFSSRCPVVRDRSRSIHEEISCIEYHGEQVYCTLAHIALASRMLIDHITPHLPKDNEEVNAHDKRLQAMLDTTTVVDAVHNHDDLTSLTTGRVPVGTQAAASLHQMSTAEGVIRTTATCVTSSAAEMHVAGLKTDAKS